MSDRNLAGQAKFQMELGMMLIMTGRNDEAADAFIASLRLLKNLEIQLDEGTYPRPIYDET